MNHNDHLSNEVRVSARISDSGLSASAKSRAIASFDRLIGSLLDVPTAKIESWANRIRKQSHLEDVYKAAADGLDGINPDFSPRGH